MIILRLLFLGLFIVLMFNAGEAIYLKDTEGIVFAIFLGAVAFIAFYYLPTFLNLNK